MQERAAKRYQNALKSLELAAKASQALSRSNSSAAATRLRLPQPRQRLRRAKSEYEVEAGQAKAAMRPWLTTVGVECNEQAALRDARAASDWCEPNNTQTGESSREVLRG